MNDFKNMFGSTTSTQAVSGIVPVPTMTLVPSSTPGNLVAVKPTIPTNITTIGKAHTDRLNDISAQVLAKVKTADMGNLGSGITQVLGLIQTVDMSKFNEPDATGFGKMVKFFKETKVQLMARYENVNTQLGNVVAGLKTDIANMEAESKWLTAMYDENLKSVHGLQQDIADLLVIIEQQTAYVDSLKAIQNPTQEQDETLSRELLIQDQLLKQHDRLECQLQIGIMDAPDIRSLQKNNFDTTTDFGDIISVTIPQWGRNLAKALIAQRQVKRAELGNSIKDQNNALMRQSADMMHSAGIKTAQLSQRSSVADMDTFEYAQTKLIDRMTQVRQIESTARAQRATDILKLQANREKLKEEMRKW